MASQKSSVVSYLEQQMNKERKRIECILRQQAIRQDQIVARLLHVKKQSDETASNWQSGVDEVALEERNKLRATLARERMQRQDDAQRKIVNRNKELEAQRGSHKTNANCVSPKTAKAKEVGLKEISIEQARQHEHDLKEREKRRVAALETKMEIMKIGDAIQRGDE
jgi:hypothetical protein